MQNEKEKLIKELEAKQEELVETTKTLNDTIKSRPCYTGFGINTRKKVPCSRELTTSINDGRKLIKDLERDHFYKYNKKHLITNLNLYKASEHNYNKVKLRIKDLNKIIDTVIVSLNYYNTEITKLYPVSVNDIEDVGTANDINSEFIKNIENFTTKVIIESEKLREKKFCYSGSGLGHAFGFFGFGKMKKCKTEEDKVRIKALNKLVKDAEKNIEEMKRVINSLKKTLNNHGTSELDQNAGNTDNIIKNTNTAIRNIKESSSKITAMITELDDANSGAGSGSGSGADAGAGANSGSLSEVSRSQYRSRSRTNSGGKFSRRKTHRKRRMV